MKPELIVLIENSFNYKYLPCKRVLSREEIENIDKILEGVFKTSEPDVINLQYGHLRNILIIVAENKAVILLEKK